MDKQKILYERFSLNDNGNVLSYVFNTEYNKKYTGWEKLPDYNDFYYTDVTDINGKKEDGIIVYKKVK
jgi:hypothetical protein